MASDMSSSFSDIAECDKFERLYCPDFSVVRKPTNHTTFKAKSRVIEDEFDTIVTVTRPIEADGMIPITDADEVLSDHQILKGQNGFILSKQDRFTDFIELLDEYATNVTYSYDKPSNHYINPSERDVTTYTLPVTSFIKASNTDYSFGYRPPCVSHNLNHEDDDVVGHSQTIRTRYIVIDGERYSNFRTYKRSGNRFVPINFPNDVIQPLTETEQIFRFSKKSIHRDNLTFTFSRDVSVNSIILHPERAQYEYVHSTAIRCPHRCAKRKHCISVLKNDPQYLSKFELHYRSNLTNGQWVKHGVFAGSLSMFNEVRINFDEVQMKELRIVPVTYHKGFDKITIDAVGTAIHTAPVSTDLVVTYKVFTPRDGKYLCRFDQLKHGMYKGYGGCNCSMCTGKATGKGFLKEKRRNFAEVCSDVY